MVRKMAPVNAITVPVIINPAPAERLAVAQDLQEPPRNFLSQIVSVAADVDVFVLRLLDVGDHLMEGVFFRDLRLELVDAPAAIADVLDPNA